MIAPEPARGSKDGTSRLVLLRNNLLASALIFAVLQAWRPYFFLTDDNLDGGFPLFSDMGRRLLHGQSPYYSDLIFGGHYDLLRDPTCFLWHPIYFLSSLLVATPFHFAIIDASAFFFLMLATAGFVNLAWYLRREMDLTIGDGWIMFYTLSYTYSMMALASGASWLNFLGNHSALPWLALGILQKDRWRGLGLVALFSLHQVLGGHLMPTLSTSLFFSLFALGIGWSRKSWRPILNWFGGSVVALIVVLPLLIPASEGFLGSGRSHGVTPEDMQGNNIPFDGFPTSLFFGMALWYIHPQHPEVTYVLALGSAAAAWSLMPAVASHARWRGLPLVCLALMAFTALMIVRPSWMTEIMIRLPVVRAMRWPFRDLLHFQFFLHLFLVTRPPGMTPRGRRLTALLGTSLLVLPLFLYINPPTFNNMHWDREILLSGTFDRYWVEVKKQLKPEDRIAVILPGEFTEESKRFRIPYSLLGTYNYTMLVGVVNSWGYSQTAPNSAFYTRTIANYPFGAFTPDQKTALMAERPELKFITLESVQPLRITLSSRDGPTVDLTPFVPMEMRFAPDGPRLGGP